MLPLVLVESARQITLRQLWLQGAEAALQALATVFGRDLLQKLPRLWEYASASIATDAAAAALGHLSPPTAEGQVRFLQHQFFRPCISEVHHPLIQEAPLSVLPVVCASENQLHRATSHFRLAYGVQKQTWQPQ